jgi:CBS domain-containing protein
LLNAKERIKIIASGYRIHRARGFVVKVSSILDGKRAETVKPDATLKELTEKLAALKIGALVVSTDGKTIEGIVSERDIVQAMPANWDKIPTLHVRDIMTVNVMTCNKEATFAELMVLMTQKRIRHVPIVDEQGQLVSIVSIGDVVKNHISEIDSERTALIDYVKSSG